MNNAPLLNLPEWIALHDRTGSQYRKGEQNTNHIPYHTLLRLQYPQYLPATLLSHLQVSPDRPEDPWDSVGSNPWRGQTPPLPQTGSAPLAGRCTHWWSGCWCLTWRGTRCLSPLLAGHTGCGLSLRRCSDEPRFLQCYLTTHMERELTIVRISYVLYLTALDSINRDKTDCISVLLHKPWLSLMVKFGLVLFSATIEK